MFVKISVILSFQNTSIKTITIIVRYKNKW